MSSENRRLRYCCNFGEPLRLVPNKVSSTNNQKDQKILLVFCVKLQQKVTTIKTIDMELVIDMEIRAKEKFSTRLGSIVDWS